MGGRNVSPENRSVSSLFLALAGVAEKYEFRIARNRGNKQAARGWNIRCGLVRVPAVANKHPRCAALNCITTCEDLS